MARLPRHSKRQAAMLRAYLRELRCVDEYIKQVHGILRRPNPNTHANPHPDPNPHPRCTASCGARGGCRTPRS